VPTERRGETPPSERVALRLAFEVGVVRRALAFAVVVGSVLIVINHGDAILSGDVAPGRWLKMGLTVLVPYVVSTLSSVMAMRGGRDSG
jgi:hypothetical protein